MTTYSFHPVKTITTGEGGAVVVRDRQHLEAVRRFRNHGLVRDPSLLSHSTEGPWHQEVQTLGLNYRMPDILAGLGVAQLRKLRGFVSRRAVLVARYRDALANVPGLRLLEVRPDVEPAWHLFPVRIPADLRRAVFDRPRERAILTQVHYLPVYRHPFFAGSDTAHECPVADAAYAELLSLPLFVDLREDQQDGIVSELLAAMELPTG